MDKYATFFNYNNIGFNMKLKNNSNRNINLLGTHNVGRGMPFAVSVIAGSTLELTDAEFAKVNTDSTKELVALKVIEIVEAAESKLTAAEIIEKVEKETGVKLPTKLNKKELQDKAKALNVEL